MNDRDRSPFHTISAEKVYRKIEDLEKVVTVAITRMEAVTEKTEDNTQRIKALEVKVYGIAAGLLAGIVALISGVFG